MVASLDPIEFATRVHALARRARPETRTGQILRHRDLVMDVAAHEVRIAGRQVALTAQPTVSSGARRSLDRFRHHAVRARANVTVVHPRYRRDRTVDSRVN